jgi:K+-transporting ATPase KdpF subunit
MRNKRIPYSLFLTLCFNLVLATSVHAATGDVLSRTQAYAIGLLGLTTLALSIYLFVVMFQPERF